ncbi:hypothetical protein COLO4_16656 [Corchorus olitorius]|uniref:RNase H type-1 domain-containing protein n=1 Tax=Corchorus olitorius TaxID=93759 RepID=A0A1R3JG52_9ROSI|nr:hypothetical protein COLO4_16656 [Corchorus olitorius]
MIMNDTSMIIKEKQGLQFWQKPPHEWIKVNSDGAFSSHSGKAGIGVVVRNSDGEVLDAFGKSVVARDALMAEALVMREGAKLAVAANHEKVIFEVDSAILFADVNNKDCSKIDWKIKAVVQDIHILVNSLQHKKFQLVNRGANLAADWFTKQSRLGMNSADWRRHPPSFLVGIWNKDGVPAPH